MYQSQTESVVPVQRAPVNRSPVPLFYSCPISNSNGCPAPSLQITGSFKQDAALSPCWHSSSSSMQQTNLMVDALHPSTQNGSAVPIGQENGRNWANQTDVYRGYYDAANSQGSSPSSASSQDILNASGTVTGQAIQHMTAPISNGVNMEREDSRCSSVTLESFLHPSNHRRPGQAAPHASTSVATPSNTSLNSMSNAFELNSFTILDSFNESRLRSNPNLQNQINNPSNQYFGSYIAQEELLNPFGDSFGGMI